MECVSGNLTPCCACEVVDLPQASIFQSTMISMHLSSKQNILFIFVHYEGLVDGFIMSVDLLSVETQASMYCRFSVNHREYELS